MMQPTTVNSENDVISKIAPIDAPAAGMHADTSIADGRPLLRTAPSQAERRLPERAVRLLPPEPIVGPDVLSDACRRRCGVLKQGLRIRSARTVAAIRRRRLPR